MSKISLMANTMVKMADYSTLKPANIANRHLKYIQQRKEQKSKTESSLYTEAKMIHYLFNFLIIKNISDLSLFSYATSPNIIEYIQGGQSKGLFRVNNAKFGILIQAYTGLRISEVLYLKIGCVEKDNKDKCWLTAEIEKTEGEATPHKILILEGIYNLILEMDALTEPLRQEAKEKKYLFYVLSQKRKNGTLISGPQRYRPTPVESGKWNKDVLQLFLERNNLPTSFKNSQNHTIDMSSHCFRHTFARIAVVEKNVNPSVIQTHFKHLSIEMTMRYVNLTKTDLKKSYLQGMIEADNIYTQGKEGVKFKKQISDVKTVDDLN